MPTKYFHKTFSAANAANPMWFLPICYYMNRIFLFLGSPFMDGNVFAITLLYFLFLVSICFNLFQYFYETHTVWFTRPGCKNSCKPIKSDLAKSTAHIEHYSQSHHSAYLYCGWMKVYEIVHNFLNHKTNKIENPN